jgi:RNA-splicing ligase RtcB
MNNSVDIKIFAKSIEEEAKKQIDNIVNNPAFEGAKIRIMPDVHAGKGCVCGFTANLGNKVVPNLIGVDIGCGVLACGLGKIDINFEELDNAIRKYVPCGRNVSEYDYRECEWYTPINPANCYAKFSKEELDYFAHSMGTLGGGNHFIEIDEDEEGNKYLLIHTGSRQFGKKVCDYWQKVSEEECNTVDISEIDNIINNK